MTKTILIIEDDKMNMRLFSDLLRANGYKIEKSFDGIDTENLVKEHQPDLIIMDGKLSEHCDPKNSGNLPEHCGLEITKRLKDNQEFSHIPIVISSSCGCLGFSNKIEWSKCDAFVAKPISVPHFLETIAKHIA